MCVCLKEREGERERKKESEREEGILGNTTLLYVPLDSFNPTLNS